MHAIEHQHAMRAVTGVERGDEAVRADRDSALHLSSCVCVCVCVPHSPFDTSIPSVCCCIFLLPSSRIHCPHRAAAPMSAHLNVPSSAATAAAAAAGTPSPSPAPPSIASGSEATPPLLQATKTNAAKHKTVRDEKYCTCTALAVSSKHSIRIGAWNCIDETDAPSLCYLCLCRAGSP